jgi:hypothetical protein
MAVVRHVSPTPAPKGVKAWLQKALQRARTKVGTYNSNGLTKSIVGPLLAFACVVIAVATVPWGDVNKLWLAIIVLAACIPLVAIILMFRAEYMLRRAFVVTLGVVATKSWFPTLGIEFVVGNTKSIITAGDRSGGLTTPMVIIVAFAFVAAVIETVFFSRPAGSPPKS